VSKVEFFSNGSKLGETTQSPFTFMWTNASPGVDLLTAKATDNGGKTATSGPVSITVFPPPPGSGIGVYGEYFDNLNFTSFVITEIDPVIDFDLTFGNFPPPSIAPTTFSVRWTGAVQPFYSDNYTFYALSDDGVRLYIDGRLVIDNFTDHTPTENSGTISLQAGRLYSVRMEYYQNQNGASARLSWSSTNQFKQIIPQSQLYPLPMIATNPLSAAVGVGANVTLAVAAYGQPPLTFQWRSNDVNIAGATGASLVVSNVQLGPPIGYSVMVGNTYGAVTSTLATLNVGFRPTMLEDPKSQIVLSGSNVSLNVSASGTLPLSYRWRKPPLITVLTNYILFASNSVWNIPNVQLNDAGTYTVVLTNLFGSATNRPVGQSSNAFLSVVSSQTTNIITDQGSNVSLLISAASSAALGYRWRFNLADILPDATNSSLLLPNLQATNAGNYYGIVTNTAGAVTTLVATVAVVLRDSDHDGMPDDWEYIAGTDPYDPSSVLKLQLLDTGNNGALLRFLAMSNISYTLEYRTNLTQGPWRKLTDVGGQPGTNTVQILDPFIPTNSRRYYRIATPQRP